VSSSLVNLGQKHFAGLSTQTEPPGLVMLREATGPAIRSDFYSLDFNAFEDWGSGDRLAEKLQTVPPAVVTP
jgi:hypothetical protein